MIYVLLCYGLARQWHGQWRADAWLLVDWSVFQFSQTRAHKVSETFAPNPAVLSGFRVLTVTLSHMFAYAVLFAVATAALVPGQSCVHAVGWLSGSRRGRIPMHICECGRSGLTVSV